jgi:LuxR family maltose regulon positive regulatory protein
LIERLNAGLHSGCKLTLISAPAGFGKTTILSEWINDLRFANDDFRLNVVNPQSKIVNRIAWLSLDEGDNDLNRFLAYLVAALQTTEGSIGQGLLAALQSPGAVNVEAVLTPKSPGPRPRRLSRHRIPSGRQGPQLSPRPSASP